MKKLQTALGTRSIEGSQPIRKRIKWDVIRSFAAYSFAPGVGLLTAPILAHSLGVEGRGQLAALMQPLTVADSIAALGIPTATAFFIARGADVRRIQKRAYLAAAITALIAFSVLAVYSAGVARSQGIPQVLLVLIWLSIVPGALLAVRRSAWTGLQLFKRVDIERALFAGSRLAIIVGLAALGLSNVLLFAAGPIVVGLLISTIVLVAKLRLPRASVESSVPRRSDFFRFSVYAAMGTVSASASARLDQAIMPGLTTSEQLGLYAVAVTVAEVPLLVGTVLARNLIAEASAGHHVTKMVRQVLFGLAVAVLGSSAIGLLSSWLIPIFFGESFSGSISPIYVLLAATCFSVVTLSFCAILTGWNHPLLASVPQLVAVIVVVAGFSFLGHGISAVQSSLIALVAQSVSLVSVCILVWFAQPKRGRHRLDQLGRGPR